MTNKKIYIQDNIVNDPTLDKFGHYHIAEAISESIINSEPPFIIGIFGGWGTGKSSLLQLIKKTLSQNNAETIYLDAWNYSTTNNLRRAFLVFMAKELDPKKLDELRIRLYSTEEQKTTIKESSDKNFWEKFAEKLKNIFISSVELIFTFLIFTTIIFLCIFIYDLLVFKINSNLTWNSFITSYKILDQLIDYKEILYVPFLLLLINKFPKINLHQNPVTIFHERIDAEELFAEYFEKIINKKIVGKKKKLIIFIDNLDRLNDEKIIEALESIKTFATQPKCIFVIACDDNVVRKVINNSKRVINYQNENSTDDSTGEHYLDKFFQQTFGLPEFMPIDLHDFAMKIFQTTKLYDSLISKKIDIRNLISIILPSDISSPRKVKRLLNDFIALHEIVIRRENEESGQLRKGAITENIEFLGKFSTIKSEFPDIYLKLRKNPKLIEEINHNINTNSNISEEYSLSFLNYLRKTITITVENIEPYIWLSQDNLSLGLSREHHTQLRIDLANGNLDNIINSLKTFPDDDYKQNYINVASRLVEQRLEGIEKQNGLKILLNLIPLLTENLRDEIAHLCAKLMPNFNLQVFSVVEIINLIKFNNKSNIKNYDHKLIDSILESFDNLENSKKTVELIINNSESIEKIGKTKLIVNKINEIIISAIKEELSPTLVDFLTVEESNLFCEWYLSLSNSYNNLSVFQNYFSDKIVVYGFHRLIDESSKINIFDEISDPFSMDVFNYFETITPLIKLGLNSDEYWKGIISFLPNSLDFEESSYFINNLNNTYDKLPLKLKEFFVGGLISGLRRVGEISSDNKKIQNILKVGFNIVLDISKKKLEFSPSQFENLESEIHFLLENKECFESTLDFIKDHISIFGEDKSGYLINNLIQFFELSFNDINMNRLLINKLVPIKSNLSVNTKTEILQIIFNNFSSNNISKIETSVDCLLSISENKEFSDQIESNQENLILLINDNDINIFTERLKLAKDLSLKGIFDANNLVFLLIQFFPFENNQAKIEVFLETVSEIWLEINEENIKILIETLLENDSLLGRNLINLLEIIAPKLGIVDTKSRTKFSQILIQNYSTNPIKYISILSDSSNFLEEDFLKDHIKQIFECQINHNTIDRTIETVQKLLNRLNFEELLSIIEKIIDLLYPIKQNAKNFINVLIEILEIETISKLRNNSVNNIYEKNNQIGEVEKNLLILESTSSKNIREIKQIVDLFVYLFGKEEQFVELALDYVVDCLTPLKIRNDHKHILAEVMGKAALRTESKDLNRNIHDKADLIGLKWFSYKKYWDT